MNSAEPARPRWSLFSSAIWTPVSKLPFPQAQMRLSVKVKRPSEWPNVCAWPPRAFVLDDATWLNQRLKIRRANAAPSAGVHWDSFSKRSRGGSMNKDVFEGKWKQVRGE